MVGTTSDTDTAYLDRSRYTVTVITSALSLNVLDETAEITINVVADNINTDTEMMEVTTTIMCRTDTKCVPIVIAM